jgi:hypothetical protein
MRSLREQNSEVLRSPTGVVAALISTLGILALIAVVLGK